jgi:hypothetical protein
MLLQNVGWHSADRSVTSQKTVLFITTDTFIMDFSRTLQYMLPIKYHKQFALYIVMAEYKILLGPEPLIQM